MDVKSELTQANITEKTLKVGRDEVVKRLCSGNEPLVSLQALKVSMEFCFCV